jgi:hypothetical protein
MPDDQHDLAATMRARGAEPKFCRDCRHYWKWAPRWMDYQPRPVFTEQCRRVVSLVTGEPERRSAEEERADVRLCGPDAAFWEAKANAR